LEDVFKFGNEKESVSLKNMKFILGGQKSPQEKLNNASDLHKRRWLPRKV
jgi:hypothetical protein